MSVVEVTLDFSDSMHSIVEKCFPNAMRTLDRFHHQQFCLEALQVEDERVGKERRSEDRRGWKYQKSQCEVLPQTFGE